MTRLSSLPTNNYSGNAIVAAANRIFGIMVSPYVYCPVFSGMNAFQAPLVALYADLTTSVPIYIAGTLFLVAAFISLLLPFDPRGKASM